MQIVAAASETPSPLRDGFMTRSGRIVDRTAPRPDDWVIDDLAYALANLCRFGGEVFAPDPLLEHRFYSVAEHSLHVADLIRLEHPDAPVEWELEALLHDLSEPRLSDIIAPLKRLIPGIKAIEERMERSIAEAFRIELPLRPEIDAIDKRIPATEAPQLFPNADPEYWRARCGEPFAGLVVPDPRFTVTVRLSPEQRVAAQLPAEMRFTSFPPLVALAFLERFAALSARRR